MNYLAHALLAEKHPESLIGNLAGDFVKGPVPKNFSPLIRRGIILHRRIDSFTDSHAGMPPLKALFSSRRRRYAGIILDISFDHFLTRNWETFSDQDLGEFIDNIYRLLTDYHQILPGKLKSVAPRMVTGDWLNKYRTLAGTGMALDGVGKRLRHANPMAGSIEEVSRHFDVLEAGFLRVFPEVVEFAGREATRLASTGI